MRRLLFLLTLLLCGAMTSQADDNASLAKFPRDSLTIATSSARAHRFDIWLARSFAEQERGLMFVTQLNANQGMLFVEEPPRVMSMWMKNTLIPLDMLFIAADGRIVYIRANATPQSLTVIGYDKPVRAVLELRGGEATARGIRTGDLVENQYFKGGTEVKK
jgi:uncharacterized protein